MPAHLWDRAGEFRAGEEANRLSVAAGGREGDNSIENTEEFDN